MTITTQNSTVWRVVFLALETALVVSGIVLAVTQSSSRHRFDMAHTVTETIFGSTFVVSMFALLFGSLWFIPSLRRVALVGWLLGFAAFVWCILSPTL